MNAKIVEQNTITKAPTGIPGLDDITYGGLPAGRPTLISGGPGSGKTLLGISFLVEGAQRFNEPGVLLTFEENAEELAADVFVAIILAGDDVESALAVAGLDAFKLLDLHVLEEDAAFGEVVAEEGRVGVAGIDGLAATHAAAR